MSSALIRNAVFRLTLMSESRDTLEYVMPWRDDWEVERTFESTFERLPSIRIFEQLYGSCAMLQKARKRVHSLRSGLGRTN